jgi:tetratricopeptide (TPR) repeat protein
LIHFFNDSPSDTGLFNEYPITHLAVDASNWQKAVEQFPELENQIPIARYWIRDYQVQLFNVSRLFGNAKAQAYPLSVYEQAVYQFHEDKTDSAFITLGKIPDIINTSKSAGWLFSQMFKKQEQVEYARTMMMVLADRYPTDFYLQLECGHFLQQLALVRNDRAMLARAERYFQRAVILNPYRADYANNLFGETLKRMSQGNNYNRP